LNAQNDELVCKGNCVSRTTGALTRTINHERMPVILSGEDQFETWLSGPVEEAFALARSFDPCAMRVVQSGKEKEDLLGRPATTH